jgi:hypothetical protein
MEYEGINGDDDVKTASPDAFRFHGTFKSIARMLLSRIKTPQPWLDDMHGNMEVLRDIYYEYLEHEKQTCRPGEKSYLRASQDRKTVISAAIPFSLAIAHYDPNYSEVANWFLYRICEEYKAGKFVFAPTHVLPDSWYQDGRGRAMPDYEESMRIIRDQTEKNNNNKN